MRFWMVYWFRCIRGWSICWRRRRRGIRIGPKNIPNKNANYYSNYLKRILSLDNKNY